MAADPPAWPKGRPARDHAAERRRADQPVLEGVDDQLHPVAQAQLRQDAADVRLHGRLAEKLPRRDLAVAQPARRQEEDVPLARGERREGLRLDRPGGAGVEVLEQLARRARGEHGGSGVHGADGREQELGVGVLEQEPARSAANGPGRGLVEIEGGQDDDPGPGTSARLGCRHDALGRLDAVHHGHPDVHQDHVGPSGCRELDRRAAVTRLADDLEVGLGGDQHPDSRPEQRLVVDERDPDRATHADTAESTAARSGSQA